MLFIISSRTVSPGVYAPLEAILEENREVNFVMKDMSI